MGLLNAVVVVEQECSPDLLPLAVVMAEVWLLL